MIQEILQGWNAEVQDMPDGGRAIILTEVHPPSGSTKVLPMPIEVAEKIGHQLSAPKVFVPEGVSNVRSILKDGK